MKIFTDLDDTVNRFTETLLKYNNSIHSTNFAKSDITYWHWWNNAYKNPFWPTTQDKFWDDVGFDIKAIDVLLKYINQGHQVYLVSASSFTSSLSRKIANTILAFQTYYNNVYKIACPITERNIIICYDKFLLSGPDCVLIDDRTTNIERFNGYRILVDQPWNKHCDAPYTQRAMNWADVDMFLREITHDK